MTWKSLSIPALHPGNQVRELVRQFGQIAAKELRAIGIQCLLGPMADTSTEPRWNRISGTFGEDANLNATLIKAIVEGFQG